MRLLFVHERFGALGGAEANILLTAQELQLRGHGVGIAHGASTGFEAGWKETFADRFELGHPAGEDLWDALAEYDPDAVYLHKFSDPDVLDTLSDWGRPVIRMVHDHDLCCMRSYKYNYFSRRICTRPASPYCVFPCGAFLTRATDGGFPLRYVSYGAKRREIDANKGFHRMIVATSYMREELVRNGFDTDKIEIHAPVPRAAQWAESPSFGERNLIVYSGQVIRGKGVDALLRSLARVQSPFECWVLGDGSHRAECERLSRRLGLEGRVHFGGFVPQAKIQELYRDASLAVMSSLWPEPFGAAGLEAMRCGLPVVAFDAGGIREWLLHGVNGILAPWMDCDAFAQGVDMLLRDKALARSLGQSGRQLADERFSLERYISGLEGLFARAADQAEAAALN